MALSSAEMELSRAEESVGKLEAAWIKWAKITIVLLLVPVIYGAWIVIVALRDEWRVAVIFQEVVHSIFTLRTCCKGRTSSNLTPNFSPQIIRNQNH